MNVKHITTAKALTTLCQNISTANPSWLAIDTEFIREKTYFPKLCLIQIATEQLIAYIDPIVIDDLTPFFNLLKDTAITKVFHAAKQDLEILYLTHPDPITPLFDTQIAAAILGMGEQIGYANAVLDMFNIKLGKHQTRTNWQQRPLSPEQVDYALDDVRHLGNLYLLQKQKLTDLNRLPWQIEECEKLSAYNPQPNSDEAWKKIKAFRQLKPKQKPIVRLLAKWREQYAIEKNKPRQWILKDEKMILISKCTNLKPDELIQRCGINPYHIDEIQTIIKNAKKQDITEDEVDETVPLLALSDDQNAISTTIYAIAQRVAIKNKINVNMLTSKKEITTFLSGDQQVGFLTNWRKELLGDAIIQFMNQQVGLEIIDKKLELKKISDISR